MVGQKYEAALNMKSDWITEWGKKNKQYYTKAWCQKYQAFAAYDTLLFLSLYICKDKSKKKSLLH